MAAPCLRAVLLASLVAFLSVAVPAAAHAGSEQAAVDKVTNLNKKAIDAYNKQDYETARELLKEALEICAANGLDKHPIRARTHIHFGIVAIVGFHQREVGLKQFRKALDVQPEIKLTKSLATPELQDAFEEAVLASESGGDKGGGAEAAAGGEGGNAPDGEEGGEEGGRRPPPKRPPARKKAGGDEGEDEKSDYKGQTGAFFIALTGGTGVGLVKGEGELDPAVHQLSSPGFAMPGQSVMATPEVGFFLNPDLLLSAALRLQYVFGVNGKPPRIQGTCGPDNFCSPGTGAVAGFARLTYLLTGGPMHFTVGGQIGGGNIRNVVEFPEKACKASSADTMTQTCFDTLAGGPFLIGPTGGLFWELGSVANLIVQINTAVGVPHFTFNFDFAAGFGFRI